MRSWSPGRVLLLVEQDLQPQIQTSLDTFRQDLEAEGYSVTLSTVSSETSPYDIREMLRVEYSATGLDGAILIGDIRAAYTEIHIGGSTAGEVFISLDAFDMYLMDLDGQYEHIPAPEIPGDIPASVAEVTLYDTCQTFADEYVVYIGGYAHRWDYATVPNQSQYGPEIWVSRIMGHNLSILDGSVKKTEAEVITDFFASNHLLRRGGSGIANHAHFCSGIVSEIDPAHGMSYPGVFSQSFLHENITSQEYVDILGSPSGSRLVFLSSHSCPPAHFFEPDESWLFVDELEQTPKTSVFYILNACSSCRWDQYVIDPTSPNYLGGLYVFDEDRVPTGYGQGAIGFTGVGGFNLLPYFSERVSANPLAGYGEAFREYLDYYVSTMFCPLNYVFLGDPTKGPAHGVVLAEDDVDIALSTDDDPLQLGEDGILTAVLSGMLGSSVTGTITVSDSSILSVPGTVSVPAGARWADIPVTGLAPGGPVTVTVTLPAEVGGASADIRLSVVPECPEMEARWPYGPTFAVASDGNYAYVGRGASLVVADVTDPESPVEIGRLTFPSVIEDVTLVADILYVANRHGGLRIVDVSDPAHPSELGSCSVINGWSLDVAVSGDLAALADGWSGVRIIDVSDPTTASILTSYDSPGWENGVALVDNLLVVAAGTAGMRLVDVSDPAQPQEVGVYETNGHANGVAVSLNHAFLADGPTGLRIIDISDPSSPLETGVVDTPGDAAEVAILGAHVLVADQWGGLRIVDASNPAQPSETCSYQTTEPICAVEVSGEVAYLAVDVAGAEMLGIADVNAPTRLGGIDAAGRAHAVAAGSGLAYVADARHGIRVLDVTNPAVPSEVGHLATTGSPVDGVLRGETLYVVDGPALCVVDVAEPTSPALLGSIQTPGNARDVDVFGDRAAVADGHAGLFIVDVTNPRDPTELGRLDTDGNARGVTIRGDYAYVADGNAGLRVIDVSDPRNPVEVASQATVDVAGDVEVVGSLAYVADGYAGGLRILDISNPLHPTETTAVTELGFARGVHIAGRLALVAADLNGLWVLDIADPSQPTILAGHDTGAWALGVTCDDWYAYVAASDSGVEIIDLIGCLGVPTRPVPRTPRRSGGRLTP